MNIKWWTLFFSALSSIVPFTTQLSHDYDHLENNLSFFGNFSGLSFISKNANISSSSTLFEFFNGTLNSLLNLALDEKVDDVCILNGEETNGQDIVYFGGEFSVPLGGGTNAVNILGYHRGNGKLFSLGKGLNGKVRKLFCDSASNAVFAIGDFTAPIGSEKFASGIIKWKNNDWIYPPGKGIAGSVYSVQLLPNGSEVLLGGSFSESADGAASISPLPLFSQSWKISAPANLADADSLKCSTNNDVWSLNDNSTGELTIEFGESVNVTMVKLFNPDSLTKGTKTFNLYALGSRDILALKYLDPGTLSYKTCTECSLGPSGQREFYLPIVRNMAGLVIALKTWYGSAAGLKSVEVYQSTVKIYAIGQLNTSPCASLKSASSAERSGSWTVNNNTNIALTYLGATASGASSTVTFSPNIPSAGLYQIWLVQPSCDTGVGGRCDQRGSVQVNIVTGIEKSSLAASVFTISQATPVTRVFISELLFEKNSDIVKPTISVTFTAPAGSNLVAAINGIEVVPVATKLGLNGFLSITTDFKGFGSLSLGNVVSNGPITALAPTNEQLYLAGNFSLTGANQSCFIAELNLKDGSVLPLANNGPNGLIHDLVIKDTVLYLAGNFSQTLDNSIVLNRLISLELPARKWRNLTSTTATDIKGDVLKLVILKNTELLHVIGNYATLGLSPSEYVENYGVLNITSQKWSSPSPYLRGNLHAGGYSHKSQVIFASGIFNQTESLLTPRLYTNNSNSTRQAALSYAAASFSSPLPSISTGIYYVVNRNGITMRELAIAAEKNNSTDIVCFNSVALNWTVIYGIENSTSVHLGSIGDSVLFAGNTNTDGGLKGPMLWNATSQQLLPQTFPSDSVINTIKAHPSGEYFVVGGRFSLAQEDCESLCSLELKGNKWKSIGKGLKGEVYDLQFHQDYIVVVGNITVKSAKPQAWGWRAAIYNLATTSWRLIEGELPGPPNSLAVVDSNSTIFVGGSVVQTSKPYIFRWDGLAYQDISQGLGESRAISKILLTSLDPLRLVAVGQLKLDNTGISYVAAMWDQTNWRPIARASGLGGDAVVKDVLYLEADVKEIVDDRASLMIMILVAATIALIVSGIGFLMFMRSIRRKNQKLAIASSLVNGGGDPRLKLSEFISISNSGGGSDVATNPLNYKLADYDVYQVKYPFQPQEQWELPLSLGDKVYVLDNTDRDWWIGVLDRGPRETLKQGVFPSSCVQD